jgi:multidrug efflux pump subunit AcrA (membrane-fusion protein)
VGISQVTVGDISVVYTYAGDLQAVDSIKLVPMVNGRVQEIPVVVGDRLQTGDPIAVIDSETYEAQLKQAQAALKLAKTNLAKMEDGTRQETLAAARAAVEYSREALVDVETVSDDERTTAAAALAQAEANLKLAQSEYDNQPNRGSIGSVESAIGPGRSFSGPG